MSRRLPINTTESGFSSLSEELGSALETSLFEESAPVSSRTRGGRQRFTESQQRADPLSASMRQLNFQTYKPSTTPSIMNIGTLDIGSTSGRKVSSIEDLATTSLGSSRTGLTGTVKPSSARTLSRTGQPPVAEVLETPLTTSLGATTSTVPSASSFGFVPVSTTVPVTSTYKSIYKPSSQLEDYEIDEDYNVPADVLTSENLPYTFGTTPSASTMRQFYESQRPKSLQALSQRTVVPSLPVTTQVVSVEPEMPLPVTTQVVSVAPEMPLSIYTVDSSGNYRYYSLVNEIVTQGTPSLQALTVPTFLNWKTILYNIITDNGDFEFKYRDVNTINDQSDAPTYKIVQDRRSL